MIVDLLRNDLGRIAVPGSVRVPEMFTPERYETVWQLTSTIVARLPSGVGLPEVFRALFPSGSVTRGPKIPTLALIAPPPRAASAPAPGPPRVWGRPPAPSASASTRAPSGRLWRRRWPGGRTGRHASASRWPATERSR